jgi:hypothetical protein
VFTILRSIVLAMACLVALSAPAPADQWDDLAQKFVDQEHARLVRRAADKGGIVIVMEHKLVTERVVLVVADNKPAISFQFKSAALPGDDAGEGTRLYALLAPHLGNSGMDNNARAGEDLLAWKGDNALCLTCDCGFSRSSAGYVGVSDGWHDFAENGRMAWTFAEAALGNVALFGELQANEGTLALGFGESLEGALYLVDTAQWEGRDHHVRLAQPRA